MNMIMGIIGQAVVNLFKENGSITVESTLAEGVCRDEKRGTGMQNDQQETVIKGKIRKCATNVGEIQKGDEISKTLSSRRKFEGSTNSVRQIAITRWENTFYSLAKYTDHSVKDNYQSYSVTLKCNTVKGNIR